MTPKSQLLFVVGAAALLLGTSPAFAGAGGAAAAQQERGDRGGERGDRGGGNRGGDGGGQRNNGGAQRDFGNRGGNGGGWQGRVQAAPQQPAQVQQPQQRPGWANGGRNGGDNSGWQNRMQEAQRDRQGAQQARPDWANGRGNGGNGNWQNRAAPAPQAPVAPRVDQKRFGQNGQQPNYRNDPRSNRNLGDRNGFNGNNNRYSNDRRPGGNFGNNNYAGNRSGAYSRNNWVRNNDWARYDRRPRTSVNIRIGGFFGPSYGSIASRYYGHNYIYYSARNWTSWNRPWRIGYVLPPAMYCEPLPYDLYFDLPPPPIGYDYVMCDGDILIVGEDSGVIYDAILPY